MSKKVDVSKRDILQCKLLLEHYRYIKEMNELSREEYDAFIEHIEPAVYAAFKNKGMNLSNVIIRNIISDYIKLIDRTMKKIKNFFNTDEYKEHVDKYKELYKSYKIIKFMYINKKALSVYEIEEKLDISHSHFCREYQKALYAFLKYFLSVSDCMGYTNAVLNNNIRIIEIMKLHKNAIIAKK